MSLMDLFLSVLWPALCGEGNRFNVSYPEMEKSECTPITPPRERDCRPTQSSYCLLDVTREMELSQYRASVSRGSVWIVRSSRGLEERK